MTDTTTMISLWRQNLILTLMQMASNHCWFGSGIKPTEAISHFHECKITPPINGTQYPSKRDQQFSYHINRLYLKSYIQNKYKWYNKVWNNMIDLTSVGRFFAKLPHQQTGCYGTKFIYNIQPIGEHKQRSWSH